MSNLVQSLTLVTATTAIVFNAVASAQAFTVYTDRSAWQTAVDAFADSVTTVDAFADSVTITDTFSNDISSAQSITLDSGIVSTNSVPPNLPNAFNNNSVSNGTYNNASGGSTGSQTITWTLPTSVFAFGADFIGVNANRLTLNVDLDGSGNQSFVVNNTIGGADGFFGVISTGNFSSVFFNSPSGIDVFSIDNAFFATNSTAIPEPLTILGSVTAIGFISGFNRKFSKEKVKKD